ncbi:enoyl-CoA hydratase-related protein [Pimelobacter simplex]|uniref:enoyl-CoA hydratase-related protein n=1 Tax=Nocardioides simplex TaxID=2045 RepID=UPI003672906C
MLTARTFSGDEALRLGVVTSVSENPLAQATELAERIAATCAPTSLMTMKQALLAPWLPRIEEAVTRVDATLDAVLGSAEFREGLDSLLEQRPPAFPGLRIDPTH